VIEQNVIDFGEVGQVDMQDVADNCIAREKVFYDGHAIAAVAADNPHVAEEAVDLIKVGYELLDPVMDVRTAMADGAPVLHDDFLPGAFLAPTEKVLPNASKLELGMGDIESGFVEADIVIEREFTTETVHQGYIETHIVTAQWGVGDLVTIWTTTQGQFAIRDQLALVLEIPMSKITVIPLEIGGGFGGKDSIYIDPLAVVLSRKSGRPVKMVMSRSETLRATGPSSGTYIKARLGVKIDGTLIAADLYAAYEAGAYSGGPVAPGVSTALTRYNIANVKIEGYDVLVNKPKMKPYRAPGATPSNFAIETMIDELCQQLEMDPVDFRLHNALTTGDRLILGFPCPEIGGVDILKAVKEHPHYQSDLEGPDTGRGFAYGFWFGGGLPSSAELMVNSDGTVQLCSGSPDMSGTRITLAMQAAEALGIEAKDVFSSVGDTASVGYSFQTVASRTTFATGIAVYEAAQKIVAQMAERAALIWQVGVDEVAVDNGWFSNRKDTKQSFSFRELAGKLDATGGLIAAQALAAPEGVGFQIAAHLVDLSVDTETGKVDILRYTAFQDAGKAVHPDYVAGQIQGGVVQGLGWALNEEYFYDKTGQLKNTSLLDYRMPTILDVPNIEAVILEIPNPGHPYGVRGVGEVPIVPPAAAVANALYDAVGIRMNALPMTPAKILEELNLSAH
jgi:CO/xanthine dehydrogenase Mo-binding subunit